MIVLSISLGGQDPEIEGHVLDLPFGRRYIFCGVDAVTSIIFISLMILQTHHTGIITPRLA
jgi:hypothetical protein